MLSVAFTQCHFFLFRSFFVCFVVRACLDATCWLYQTNNTDLLSFLFCFSPSLSCSYLSTYYTQIHNNDLHTYIPFLFYSCFFYVLFVCVYAYFSLSLVTAKMTTTHLQRILTCFLSLCMYVYIQPSSTYISLFLSVCACVLLCLGFFGGGGNLHIYLHTHIRKTLHGWGSDTK